MNFIIMLVIPWLATFLGSALGIKLNIKSKKSQALFLGFAAGIMVAAAVWSLIIPSFDESNKIVSVIITTVGFIVGCLLMLVLDVLLPHQHMDEDKPEGRGAGNIKRPYLLVMAVALHNIPEGMALGVVMAATQTSNITMVAALIFALGLALQNFPEGMAVTVPLKDSGVPDRKSFMFGTIASFAEPLAALVGFGLAYILSGLDAFVMPLLLSIAAGAMVFIIVEELIPASQSDKEGHSATFGFLLGFWIMAIMAFIAG